MNNMHRAQLRAFFFHRNSESTNAVQPDVESGKCVQIDVGTNVWSRKKLNKI